MSETPFRPDAVLAVLRQEVDAARARDPLVEIELTHMDGSDPGVQTAAADKLVDPDLPDLGAPHGAIRAAYTEGHAESAYAAERKAYYWTEDGRLRRLLLEDEGYRRDVVDAVTDPRELTTRLRAFFTDLLSPAPPATGAPEVCRTAQDLAELDGRPGEVEGRYTEIDVRQRPRGRPVHRGHVTLTLVDGTRVLVEPVWAEPAIRPYEERQALAGHMVRVRGTVHAEAPDDPDGAASLRLPCVAGIEEIRPLGRAGFGSEGALLFLPFVVAIAIGAALLWPVVAEGLGRADAPDLGVWAGLWSALRDQWLAGLAGGLLVVIPLVLAAVIWGALALERRAEGRRLEVDAPDGA